MLALIKELLIFNDRNHVAKMSWIYYSVQDDGVMGWSSS